MNIGIYFNDEEVDFIRKQSEGFVRSLVQEKMRVSHNISETTGYDETIRVAKKNLVSHNIKKEVPKTEGDGLNTCKKCGSVLPFYKAKCKNC